MKIAASHHSSLKKYGRLVLPLSLIFSPSCSLVISQKIPNDIKIEQFKYIVEGWGGRDGSYIYKWPDDEYHTKMFARWWNETKYMGTTPILPYAEGRYKLYFSPTMYISFSGGASGYVMFTHLKTIDSGYCYVCKVTSGDKELIREIVNIVKSSKKINTEYLRFEEFKSIYWKK